MSFFVMFFYISCDHIPIVLTLCAMSFSMSTNNLVDFVTNFQLALVLLLTQCNFTQHRKAPCLPFVGV